MPRTIVARDNHGQSQPDAAERILVGELEEAIEGGQMVLHFQPKATLVSGRVAAVEALVRWCHPRHGLLYPDRFLSLVEKADLMDHLTGWVLRRALDDLRGLGPNAAHVTVAVNVAESDINRPGFAELVTCSLAQAEIAPERLIIEITEATLYSDPESASVVLARLDALGVGVSIDDLGSGQTSLEGRTRLGRLSTFPIHELKIDQSFISDMLVNPANAAIVRSIVDLGHSLNLRVVGEGVESDVVWEILRALGCDSAQGYVLARPMPVEQLGHWLENSAHESHGLVEDSVLMENSVAR